MILNLLIGLMMLTPATAPTTQPSLHDQLSDRQQKVFADKDAIRLAEIDLETAKAECTKNAKASREYQVLVADADRLKKDLDAAKASKSSQAYANALAIYGPAKIKLAKFVEDAIAKDVFVKSSADVLSNAQQAYRNDQGECLALSRAYDAEQRATKARQVLANLPAHAPTEFREWLRERIEKTGEATLPSVDDAVESPSAVEVGGYCDLRKLAAKVLSSVDDTNAIVTLDWPYSRKTVDVWITGFDASALTDEKSVKLDAPVLFVGTKKYTTAIGGQRTVLLGVYKPSFWLK